ncbi:MAG TPA: M43 family zinc metalloprotease [Bacteroidia bacterium]
MKFILLILSFTVFSLSMAKAQGCGTNTAKYMQSHQQIMSSSGYQAHDTCLNKKLSLIFHVVLDSNNAPGVTPADISTCVDNLNRYFKRICITFMNCTTNYISNFNYNRWEQDPHEKQIYNNYYVDSTINIYLVESIITPANAGGYAYMPGDSLDMIVVQKSFVTGIVPIHEMGHFFGLPHTFEGPSQGAPSIEFVDGSNCSTTGDLFCDTEADPHPAAEDDNRPCSFAYGPADGNGDFYTPPVDNIMTYYKNCRCRFTQQQYNHMANMYFLKRNYLH